MHVCWAPPNFLPQRLYFLAVPSADYVMLEEQGGKWGYFKSELPYSVEIGHQVREVDMELVS